MGRSYEACHAMIEAVQCVQQGDIDGLNRLLKENPCLATERFDGQRTLLHVATDWPGHFPRGPETVATLVEQGADVNAAFIGKHRETPLHWAASTDDIAVLDALLDHGADIEAPGSVIGGGTPIADAVAFGQWSAARRLVERGACTNLWQSAALGLMPRVEKFFASDMPPADDVTNAFWCACHGGQREAAEYLLKRGADLNWVGYDNLTPIEAGKRSHAEDVVEWLRGLGVR